MWPALLAAAPGIATAAGGLAGLFGKKKKKNDPTAAGMQYLDQIPGAMKPYYQPYMDRGNAASDVVGGEYGKMINNPNAMYDKFGEGYKESPGYQFKLHQALNAGNNASAAGGMLGTPMHQEQNMDTAHGLADQDFEAYMNHILGIYGGGVSGEQGVADKGFDANQSFANMLGSNLTQKGQLAYEGANAKNQEKSQNWQNIFSGVGAAGTAVNATNQQSKFNDMMSKFFNKGGA